MPPIEDSRLGATVENYRLLSVLGTGSTSVVYLGQRLDDPLGLVAIKILSYQYQAAASTATDDHAAFRMRFLREARAASKLRHENILPVLSFGDSDELTFMVMPVIVGGTLATRLADGRGPLSLREIAAYLKQLASALDAAHARGLVHRDIKPSNILLDEHGHLFLTDFGIARIFDSGDNALTREGPATLTRTGQVLGTPYYMAPEQIRGEPVGPATDIYATGIVLYQLITGQVPFHGDTPLAVALQHLQESPPPPSLLRDELPEPIESVIMQALAKDPKERFASAGELSEAFEAGLAALGPAEEVESRSSAWRFATGLNERMPSDEDPAPSAPEEGFDALYDQLVGAQLGGYQLEHLITCTERDAVFLARRAGTAVPYRLRVLALPAELAEDERATFLDRFQAQAQALVELQHPHILALYDFGSDEGIPYLVTSDVAGQSLAEVLVSGDPLDLAAIGGYLNQISEALGYAHQQGTLHLSLTLDNVFVRDGDDVVVADFGVGGMLRDPAFETDEPASSASWRMYAPELLLGKSAGESADVYALGTLLYQLLTGHPVFADTTDDEIAEQHLHAAVPPLRTWRAGLPAGLENIAARALAKEPEHRFRRPADLAAAYRRVVARAGIEVPGGGPASASTGATLSGATIAAASTAAPSRSSLTITTKARSPSRAKPLSAPGQTLAAGVATPRTAAKPQRTPQPQPAELTPEERLKLALTGTLVRARAAAATGSGAVAGALHRVPVLKRRPWLAAVGAMALVALLGATFLWVIPHGGQGRTVARGTLASLGAHAIANVTFLDGSFGAGQSDAVNISITDLGTPPAGYSYAAWLVNNQSQTPKYKPLGALSLKDNTWTLRYSGDGKPGHPGTNLISMGDDVEITLEQSIGAAPSQNVVLAASYPTQAFSHLKRLIVTSPDTPGQQAYLTALLQQAILLQQQGQVLLDNMQRGLFDSTNCAAQNVVDLIEGKSGADYRPLPALCSSQGRNITQVDDGFGLNGYLNAVINEAKQTKTSPDAVHVEHIQMHADHVIISATNIQEWLATVKQDALDILSGHHNADQGQEVAHLTDVALNGQDLDNDESVDPVPGEAGAKLGYQHGQLLALLQLVPAK